jgi:hypothetical protein
MIFSHWAGKVSVRTQRYRLDNAGALFDLEADPGQDHDVATQLPDLASSLSKQVAAWKRELLPGLRNDNRPFTVGYPEFPLTQLPARDGVPHGGIKRSASAPNCSFFHNWTSTEDRMTWDVEVATGGEYEPVIYYTCAKADTGSVIELSLNGNRVAGKVSVPNDPPLRGAEHDRVLRKGESYVKDFLPLRLATMHLPPGRGLLSLRALNVAGKEVMDVRAVHLRLIK